MLGQVSCHNSNPCIKYLRIAKQVFCYLKNTIILGIEWENNPVGYKAGEKYGEMGILRYADSSYASDIEDRKLIPKYYFFLGGIVITWYSKQ